MFAICQSLRKFMSKNSYFVKFLTNLLAWRSKSLCLLWHTFSSFSEMTHHGYQKIKWYSGCCKVSSWARLFRRSYFYCRISVSQRPVTFIQFRNMKIWLFSLSLRRIAMSWSFFCSIGLCLLSTYLTNHFLINISF